MTAVWEVPCESTEWVGPVTVTVDGVATTGFELALVADQARPAAPDWQAPTVLGGGRGVLVSAVPTSEAGTLSQVWVRVTSNPETVVIRDVAAVLRT